MLTHSRSRPYYGWFIVVTLAITETISWGIVFYAFSVFITPMETELGWSRAELTGGISLALLVSAGMAFPVGWWIDKYGARLLMTLGSIGATAFLVAWSEVTELTQFYLIWAGMGVCFAAILYEPAFVVVAVWFKEKQSTALAIITFAAGLASTIFIPVSDLLLDSFGWRGATLRLAIFLGVTTIPLHALVLRHQPTQPRLLSSRESSVPVENIPLKTNISLDEAMHSRFFWLLTLAFSLAFLGAAAIRVHFIPFLIDNNVDASQAALASGSIGLMQVLGRLIFAPLDHRLSSRVMVSGVFALQTVAMMILVVSVASWAIGIFIVVFGMAFGALTLARPSILAESFGTSHYGRISSVVAIFLTLAGTIAPVGAGLLYDHFAGYDIVLGLVAGFSLAATIVMFWVKPFTSTSGQ